MNDTAPVEAKATNDKGLSVRAPFTIRERLIALWGVGGVLLLLGQALARLTPLALEPVADGTMTTLHWSIYLGWIVLNAWAEGYRGFQKRFSPRVAYRALYLARNPKPLHVALAPAFCMSLFHAQKRSKIVAWGILIGVIFLVIAVRQLAQPWRGIVDAGVVVGLVWGVVAIVIYFLRGLRGEAIPAQDDIPDPDDAGAVP